jgi:hypothetical protein
MPSTLAADGVRGQPESFGLAPLADHSRRRRVGKPAGRPLLRMPFLWTDCLLAPPDPASAALSVNVGPH